MRLYLVRHGQAKDEKEDPNRPLTDKGMQDVRKVAQFSKPLNIHVQRILHSGKLRAAQTAEIIAEAVQSDEGVVQHEGLNPNDPIEPILQDIERMSAELMLVGHLPFLNKLLAKLVIDDESVEIVAFQSAGMVCLEKSPEGIWKIAWMITPELLLSSS